ncbi:MULTISPECIES: putative T6SS immunity periplasmic lipoprotein [Enterobacteriaceae]|uniref:putative T6SS immunity periplasmic lipoprotein n=1 Tax=Enterobacteriaceae TaxID=543 RepID=UPI001423B60B|nr:putative T6SS immunity periplasmic lipoprotein [Enterobacter sp. Ap-1006]NIF49403.1 hypothetical protein [Enterobacter sp. Ap-1006]
MRKCLLAAAVLLLAGCPGPGDRMVPRQPAEVVAKGNIVCVVSPLGSGERITAVQINEGHGNVQYKTFDDAPVYVAKGDCLPAFGFTFSPGKKYSVAYDVKSDNSSSHLVTAEFSITENASGGISIQHPN